MTQLERDFKKLSAKYPQYTLRAEIECCDPNPNSTYLMDGGIRFWISIRTTLGYGTREFFFGDTFEEAQTRLEEWIGANPCLIAISDWKQSKVKK